MACYTVVTVNLEDSAVNRMAREKLGLSLEGPLTEAQAGRVRVEAGVIRTRSLLARMSPGAVVRRDGDRLTVTVDA